MSFATPSYTLFGEIKKDDEKTKDSSTVSLGVFEQVKWERDVALEQLEELGYSLGEKIRTDEDCISREELLVHLDQLKESEPKHYGFILSLQSYIRGLQYVKSINSSTDCISRSDMLDAIGHGTTYTSSES